MVPAAIALEVAEADAAYIFVASSLAIIPLAGWMGRATEWMAEHLGSGIGGLLNATFGNAAEVTERVDRRNAILRASIAGGYYPTGGIV